MYDLLTGTERRKGLLIKDNRGLGGVNRERQEEDEQEKRHGMRSFYGVAANLFHAKIPKFGENFHLLKKFFRSCQLCASNQRISFGATKVALSEEPSLLLPSNQGCSLRGTVVALAE